MYQQRRTKPSNDHALLFTSNNSFRAQFTDPSLSSRRKKERKKGRKEERNMGLCSPIQNWSSAALQCYCRRVWLPCRWSLCVTLPPLGFRQTLQTAHAKNPTGTIKLKVLQHCSYTPAFKRNSTHTHARAHTHTHTHTHTLTC